MPMAVLLRCFPSSPPHPPLRKPAEVFRPRRGGIRPSDNMMLISRKNRWMTVVSMSFQNLSRSCQIPSRHSREYFLQWTLSEEAFVFNWNLSGVHDVTVKYIADHQRMMSSSLQKAFTIANVLLLTLPSEVLAATCEADNSYFNMPLLLAIAVIGATVGGLLARQRRGELKRLNGQLRQINAALKRQAKIESYAPNLSYSSDGSIVAESEAIDPRKEQLVTNLRTGKKYLRNQDPEKAFAEFKAALDLARALRDHVEEKKAARGLGASLQRQGKYREAIKHHSRVLKITERAGEDSGVTEAYGAIADCYAEIGDLERAGQFYDMYIARLEND